MCLSFLASLCLEGGAGGDAGAPFPRSRAAGDRRAAGRAGDQGCPPRSRRSRSPGTAAGPDRRGRTGDRRRDGPPDRTGDRAGDNLKRHL